jgi:hypothetical protein
MLHKVPWSSTTMYGFLCLSSGKKCWYDFRAYATDWFLKYLFDCLFFLQMLTCFVSRETNEFVAYVTFSFSRGPFKMLQTFYTSFGDSWEKLLRTMLNSEEMLHKIITLCGHTKKKSYGLRWILVICLRKKHRREVHIKGKFGTEVNAIAKKC